MPLNDDHTTNTEIHEGGVRGFFTSLLVGILRDLVKFVIAFVVGTGVGAVVCWYYGLPLALSLVAGFLVLALALAFSTDSLFS